MNLSLRDIEYFLVMAQIGHMGRAAAACGVTQPALSKSLRRLEDETGLKLFDRSARRMWLSASGMAFTEHAGRLHAQYQDAVRHASALQAGQAGLLRIGATGATLDTVVMPALAILLPRRPALRVCLTVGLSDDLGASVIQGNLDMAVAPTYATRTASIDSITLFDDALDIVVRQGHPLADKADLSLSDLSSFSWVLPQAQASARQALFSLFERNGGTLPRIAMEVDFISEGTLAVIAATDLISFAPTYLVHSQKIPRVTVLSLPLQATFGRQISLLSRHGSTWTPLMDAFRDTLLDQYAGQNAA